MLMTPQSLDDIHTIRVVLEDAWMWARIIFCVWFGLMFLAAMIKAAKS